MGEVWDDTDCANPACGDTIFRLKRKINALMTAYNELATASKHTEMDLKRSIETATLNVKYECRKSSILEADNKSCKRYLDVAKKQSIMLKVKLDQSDTMLTHHKLAVEKMRTVVRLHTHGDRRAFLENTLSASLAPSTSDSFAPSTSASFAPSTSASFAPSTNASFALSYICNH